MGVLKMETVALDGTKIHANASRRALSYELAGKIEAQLKAEVTELLANAKRLTRPMFPTACRSLKNLARREEPVQLSAHQARP
jgi:hypothetical protein